MNRTKQFCSWKRKKTRLKSIG